MKALRLLLVMSVLTGVAYPLILTAVGYSLLRKPGQGGRVVVGEKLVGSQLIAQPFSTPRYFWPRPSASQFNTLPAFGSNLGPTSAILKKEVEARKHLWAGVGEPIPSELLFASGSGLDPHISRQAAYFQMKRVAEARSLPVDTLQSLIDKLTVRWRYGVPITPYINVLMLNIELDKLQKETP